MNFTLHMVSKTNVMVCPLLLIPQPTPYMLYVYPQQNLCNVLLLVCYQVVQVVCTYAAAMFRLSVPELELLVGFCLVF